MIFINWFFGRDPQYVSHWSPAISHQHELRTYRMLGIRPEPTYEWSVQFRKNMRVAAPTEGDTAEQG